MSRRLVAILLLGLIPVLSQCSHDIEDESWRQRLYTPTYYTKLAGTYFLVDTYHHRILYSGFPYEDLDLWFTLTDRIGGPHSIASDGDIVVYDDTGFGNLRAARHFNLSNFSLDTQGNADQYEIIFDVGVRPHRVIYDDEMESFYAISSGTQEILRVTNELGNLVIRYREELSFLNKAYTRSMTIIEGHMFFVTRAHGIIEATYLDDVFELVRSYPVPDILYDLNDIFRSEAGWYYISSTPTAIIRVRSLDDIATGNYEYLSDVLGLEGTPYYLAEFDGLISLAQVGDSSGIITFRDAETGPVYDIRTLYDFGPPSPADEARKAAFPR